MRGSEVPRPVLMHWWLCGRKRAYVTRTIAELHQRAAADALGPTVTVLHPYRCPVTLLQGAAAHWHLGHTQNARLKNPAKIRNQAIGRWNQLIDRSPRSFWYSS